MKKLLFLFLLGFCVTITSCKFVEEKRAREQYVRDSIQHVQDSIRLAQGRAIFVADSLERVRLDSLALIAWGDAKFGMSQKEVLATRTFKGSRLSDDRIYLPHNKITMYKDAWNLKLGICWIWALFKNDELTNIVIESSPCLYWDRLHSHLIHDVDLLLSKFAEKNSLHFTPQSRKVSISDFKSDDSFLYERLSIESKSMSVYLKEDSYHPSYSIWISNIDFPKKQVETTEEKLEKKRKQEAKSFADDSSF
jgi:hypothetical protein